jgi:tetratricopeptide (TPR) repeat protein
LKPENIIINMDHRTTPPTPIPQIADFSFSHIALADQERISLPRSWPWCAPEWHARTHTLQQAQCMDVYSYGLLSYWILFGNQLTDEKNFALEVLRLEQLITQGTLLETISRHMSDMEQSPSATNDLLVFFNGYLSPTKERFQKMSHQIPLLQDMSPAYEVPVAVPTLKHLDFRVARCLDQLLQVDYKIRQNMFRLLQDSSESQCSLCARNATLQVALCLHLALGTTKNVLTANELLTRHDISLSFIEQEMEVLKSGKFPDRPGQAKWYIEPDLTPQYQERGEMEEAIRWHEEETRALEECFGATHPLVIMTKTTLAHLFDGNGQTMKALKLCTEQAEKIRNRVGDDHYDTIAARSQVALYQSKVGSLDEAIATGEELISQLRSSETLQETDRLTMSVGANLANFYVDANQYEKAIPMLKRLMETQDTVLGRNHPDSLIIKQSLAVCYVEHIPPRYKEALDLQSSVLLGWRQNFGQMHRHTIDAAAVYGSILYREGSDDALAFETLEWVMEASKGMLSEVDPAKWSTMSDHAYRMIAIGKSREAITLLLQSLEKLEQLLHADHPQVINVVLNLSAAYVESEMGDEAEPFLRRVLHSETCVSQSPPRFALWAWRLLGSVYHNKRNTELAKDAWDRAITLADSHWGDHHPAAREAKIQLSTLHIREGRHEDGLNMMRELVTWHEKYMGINAWATIHMKQELGQKLSEVGDYSKARDILSEVYHIAQEVLGTTEELTMDIQGNLAFAMRRNNEDEAAKVLTEDLLEKRRSTLGPFHADTVLTMRNLFRIYVDMELSSEAASLAPAYSAALIEVGDGHTEQWVLAELHLLNGKVDEGVDLFRKRLASSQEEPVDEEACITTQHCLAYMLSSTDKLNEAATLMQSVLPSLVLQSGENYPAVCDATGLLGVILRDKGDLVGAEKIFQQELRIAQSLRNGLQSHDVVWACEHLITVYEKQGQEGKVAEMREKIKVATLM